MGEFVATTAFRTQDAERVLAAIGDFLSANGSPGTLVDGDDEPTDDDVSVFPPANGWTVVLWPAYFTELAAAEAISRELGVLASTVHIYDGDYWAHSLLREGATLDRFASVPDYFTDEPDEVARLTAMYTSRPEAIADAAGCPVEKIAPYLVHLPREHGVAEDRSQATGPVPRKVFPDDLEELDSPWVFVDFWRHLGPRYPDDVAASLGRIRLAEGWLGKLPTGDAEL